MTKLELASVVKAVSLLSIASLGEKTDGLFVLVDDGDSALGTGDAAEMTTEGGGPSVPAVEGGALVLELTAEAEEPLSID